MDVESSFKVIGGLGRFQKFIVVSHFLLSMPYGFQLVFMVIAAATPDPNIPSERNMTTIVTEWNLQDKPWIVDLISSLFMAGYGIGCAVMGQVSDLCGRKYILILNYTLMHVSSLCCCFAQSWQVFAVLRTICGFGIGGSGHIVFTLTLENIGREYWGTVGMMYAPFFPIGVMLLSLMGYLLQSWRKLCLVGSLVPLIAVPVYIFILPESSRWLYNVGKVEKAEKVLQYIARKNGCPVTDIKLCSANDNELSQGSSLKKYSIIDVFKSRRLALYAIASFYIWFACSFVYYGLTLDAKLFSPNIFIANTLSGAVECPSYFIVYFTITNKSIGRKGTLIGCLILSSIASIGMLFAIGLQSDHLSTLQTVFGLTNKLAISGAFTLMYIYTAEIFPTQLRLVAIGASSFFARVGAILSPFVPLLASVLPYLAYIVYGAVAILGAGLNLLFPETLNQPSPEMSDFLPKKRSRRGNGGSDVDEDLVSNFHRDKEPLLKEDMYA